MKTIVTDIDECVLNWHQGFQNWIIQEGYTPTSDITKCLNLEDWLDKSYSDTHTLVEEFNNSIYFGELKPDYGSLEVIPKLHKKGYVFYALTSCGSSFDVVTRRKYNIELYFPGIFKEIICIDLGEDKLRYLEQFEEDSIWVEDKMKNALMGSQCGHKCFLMNHTHNSTLDSDKVIRVDSWNDIEKALN